MSWLGAKEWGVEEGEGATLGVEETNGTFATRIINLHLSLYLFSCCYEIFIRSEKRSGVLSRARRLVAAAHRRHYSQNPSPAHSNLWNARPTCERFIYGLWRPYLLRPHNTFYKLITRLSPGWETTPVLYTSHCPSSINSKVEVKTKRSLQRYQSVFYFESFIFKSDYN
jgi:hypothetical protein